jgi:pectate lyase
MIRFSHSVFAGIFLSAAALTTHAVTILDDTFADGTRNIQNLPTESAWYCSSASSLTAVPGAMTLAQGSTAILVVSYFTTNANNPVSLNVGDTLSANVTFTFTGVAAANSSQGFRFALCHFGASRANADFSSNSGQGTNVEGYGVFQNMGINFNGTTPTAIMLRTNLADKSLLSAGGDWLTLGSGPGSTNNFPGFTNNVPYTLQLSVQRTDVNVLQVTATWLNDITGATLSTAITHNGANATNFVFDGLGLRPLTDASTASGIIFNEVQVSYVAASTPPSIDANPQDQSVFIGQTATFTVLPDGTPPFTYQWLYNNDTVLTNQTNATLVINNAQLSDTGGYSVIVSNAYGSVTSDNAQLTVSTPTAPVIVTQPQDQTVIPGQTYGFTVVAGGSAPLSYQWYFNTNTLIPNATSDTLTLTNIQFAAEGTYSVVVSNFVSVTNSSYALLTVNTNPVAPSFVSTPVSQVVLQGNNASFTATVLGTLPITYQWSYNNVPIQGATSLTLTLTNVQTSASGSYTLTASNSAGGVSSTAFLTVTPVIPVVNTAYNLTGFGRLTTGGGVLAETDPNYAHVYTATDLANALTSKTVKIIEIMNDLNLGYNEIEASAKSNSEPFRAATTPLLHPVLLQSGVSLIDIQKKTGLTIFSANGSTIRHAKLNIKNDSNIIVRNLKFDQLWEWDESSKGQYDRNDWDFVTLGDGGAVSNVWIDHCTFTKSYDGIIDTKAGCSAITMSWCHYTGDDGATNTNSWVWQQINYLEQNPSSHPMYNFLRTRGFSTTNIVTIVQGHDKTHLAGQNDLDPNNATISMTFHHQWLNSVWDRCVPRLRAGNVHDYNLYVDDTSVLAAKRLRNSIAATMSTADQNTLNNTYSFNPPINGSISTENGALLLEKSVYTDCLFPLRNNQTDPSNPAYTGKILGLDDIYHMDNTDGSVTQVRGNSTDPGNPLGPFQAPKIPFSWNLVGNQLPYAYTPDDPAQLQAIVTSPTAGAGAGILTWNKTNWLVTSYAPTAPFIVAQPQNVSVAASQSATFTVLAGGTANLSYRWYFNTNTPVPNATNAILTLANVQNANAGVYTVVVTNIAGTVTSTNAILAVSGGGSPQPQLSGLVFANGTFSLTVSGGSGSDFIIQASTNLIDWVNLYTNLSVTPFTFGDSNAGNFGQQFYRIKVGP